MCGGIACCGAFACDPGNSPAREPTAKMIRGSRDLLSEVGGHLRAWREEHGRYPTNDEGLSVLTEVGVRVFPPFDDDQEMIRAWVTRGEAFYEPTLMRSDAGPVGSLLIPFLYENRRAAPPGAFDGSPADRDPDRRWSLEVDQGVFVLSVELKAHLEKRAAEDARYFGTLLATAGPAALFGLLFLLTGARARRRGAAQRPRLQRVLLRAGGALAFLASLLPWFVSASSSGCYVPNTFLMRRRTPPAAECRRILSRYRDQGAIRPETYERFVKVLDTDVDRMDD